MRSLLPAATLTLFAFCAAGFSNVSPGDPLPERTLASLDGKKQPYLAKTKVTVFFFFVPQNKNGQLGLKDLAAVEQEFAGKSVTFVGLVSSTINDEDTKREVAKAGLKAVVLKDPGDELYGALGTALTPVVGVADEKHKLVAYLPFMKLQYQDTIRAWVRFALGELNEEQLKVALAPPAVVDGGETQVAHRYFRLAERQLASGDLEKALATVKKSLEHAPDLPEANALLGAVYAAQGKCADALPLLTKGGVDAGSEAVLNARKACDAGTP